MEKTIKIEIPEGYDDVVFDKETNTIKYIKKEPNVPKTWSDFCVENQFCHVDNSSTFYVNPDYHYPKCELFDVMRILNIRDFESKNKLEALARLICLRQEWLKKYKYDSKKQYSFTVYCKSANKDNILVHCGEYRPLNFPTIDMVNKFIEYFKEDIVTAHEFI